MMATPRTDHCQHPQSPAPCLCAWPGITPAEYQELLERRRVQHVEAWERGAAMSDDPEGALAMAAEFRECPAWRFWADGDPYIVPRPVEYPVEPLEAREARRARIHASRVRRLRQAQQVVDTYEATRPVIGGVRRGPSVASNDWRKRNAAVERDINEYQQYAEAQQMVREMRRLLKQEES